MSKHLDPLLLLGLGLVFLSQFTTAQSIRKEKFRTPTSLDVFLDLYESRKFNEEWEGNWEIFFDSSCPLRYLGMKSHFFWDKTIFHEFELSCLVRKNRPATILIEGDPLGRVLLNNQISTELKPGSLYFAVANLSYWKKNHIVFQNPRLYSYGRQ